MNRLLEDDVQKLKETLLMMVSLTDRNFSLAIRAIVERDDKHADTVEGEDSQLDQLEVAVDEAVILFITKFRPVAHDLRLALVASKIASNLERIGDQAVSIARNARVLNALPELKRPIDIQRMAGMTLEMMRDAINGFVEGKADQMPEIVKRDKLVDELNKQLFRELTSYMIEEPATITRAITLLLVARGIERAADHCKAIAEEVFYLANAVDIRHTAAPARPET